MMKDNIENKWFEIEKIVKEYPPSNESYNILMVSKVEYNNIPQNEKNEIIEWLILHNLRIVIEYISKKYRRYIDNIHRRRFSVDLKSIFSPDDLFMVGVCGLIDGIRTYDTNKGSPFREWILLYIKKAINRYISSSKLVRFPSKISESNLIRRLITLRKNGEITDAYDKQEITSIIHKLIEVYPQYKGFNVDLIHSYINYRITDGLDDADLLSKLLEQSNSNNETVIYDNLLTNMLVNVLITRKDEIEEKIFDYLGIL